jgi:hypothetical protein
MLVTDYKKALAELGERLCIRWCSYAVLQISCNA